MHRNITRTSNRCLKTNVKEPCQQTVVYVFEIIQLFRIMLVSKTMWAKLTLAIEAMCLTKKIEKEKKKYFTQNIFAMMPRFG